MYIFDLSHFYSLQDYGLAQLEKSCKLDVGLRSKMCVLILVAYHSMISYLLGEFICLSHNISKLLSTSLNISCHLISAHIYLRFASDFLYDVSNRNLNIKSMLYLTGLGDGDIELATEVLRPCLRDHPKVKMNINKSSQ